MSIVQAFKRQAVPPQMAQQLQTTTIAAPTRGIIQNENFTFMQPGAAIICDNWVPTLRGVKLRGGCERWSVLPETTPTELPVHELGNPNGVAVDSAGNVYVVDDLYSQVLELQAAWNAPAELSVRGLMSPEAVAVDTVVGSLYVVDSGNNRVLKVPLRR